MHFQHLIESVTKMFLYFSIQTAYNVIAYKDKPRLRTAVEMLRTTQEIEHRLVEVCQFLDFSLVMI